jgi:hypothetical protein
MSVLIFGVLMAAALAVIAVPLGLKFGSPAMLKNLSLVRTGLLVVAAVCSGLLSLICLAAAAFGMNTSLPWGLGILMYLIPGLGFPAFVILKFGSVRVLSYVLWLMTLASSLAFYFGDQADRLASGLRPITNPTERIGMLAPLRLCSLGWQFLSRPPLFVILAKSGRSWPIPYLLISL